VNEFSVKGKELVEMCLSADQYEQEIEISLTKLLEIFATAYNVPFTVVFDKKDGSERVLRGRKLSEEPRRGYSIAQKL
jgi:hypothetical protein